METEARSEAILQRLAGLHPRKIDLSLGRIQALLARLGHPERRLPPVVHVAGTNGKGSTIAFLRSALESAGLRVHVYTSPHLVSVRERFRLAGKLVDEAGLVEALEDCESAQAGAPITLFEIMTAAAFHLFAAVPADALLLEVGLGGRYDATNVVDRPAACVIAPVSYDHQEFLGSTLAQIAGEKAGIVKPGVPVISASQEAEAERVIEREARRAGAPLVLQERDFHGREEHGRFVYEDQRGLLDLPLPRLPGRHQIQNAAVATAALRRAFPQLPTRSFERMTADVEWPARMQSLTRGPLVEAAPRGAEIWLDGGHNEAGARAAAEAIADFEERTPRPSVLICGMLVSKDPARFLAAFRGLVLEVLAVSFSEEGARPGPEVAQAAAAAGFLASSHRDVAAALRALAKRQWPKPPRILIAGSLHLAGETLRLNETQMR